MITTSDTVKFIESLLGRAQVYAKNVDVRCPFCNDSKKKRLSIRIEDHVCHCWVCGFGSRTLLPLLVKFGSRDLINEYKTKFIPELPGGANNKIVINEDEIKKIRLPNDFKLLALSRDSKDPETRMMIRYCESRGLTQKEFWRWRLGFSNQGAMRRKVIVPSFDFEGHVNYYAARTIDPPPWFYGKYKNADSDKNNIVFNELNIDWTKKLVLVEGPFDLMKCRMNATCLLGSSITPKSLLFQKILEHETPIVMMLDNEMQEKVQSIGRLFTRFNVQVYITKFNSEHDPGEMTFDQVSEYVERAVPWSWNTMFSHKIAKATRGSLKI